MRDDVTGNGVNIEKKLGDTSLEGMLRAGNLAVHLLPYSSIKGINVWETAFCHLSPTNVVILQYFDY